ncbi:GNAT family N-acetyltransferase [Aurantiacibacter spongiae]|uniref:GNAT family N-acetyltransferase n=1 Tax=Aurantiacibacter spongiae TaxID=2488860 RepID=A0A3N5CR16_9SPHN|nr:GNAT family N-acetyltransferase [Aurantiacibacter spongiae]RPF70786.1 GNAT family N-acetyltransferase [Aurantiacibacter spongiae]
MSDPVDAIMAVMEASFEHRYGEAWNRRQVSDALIMPSTHYLLAGITDGAAFDPSRATGFALTRHAADEEELLLIAVRPDARGAGIASGLMHRFIAEAAGRGCTRLFLEMRDGNPAERLYRRFGFEPVGRRRGYYRGAIGGPVDAITFAKTDV